MGRARFTTYIEGETVREAVDSMIRNVFEGRYESVKKYVGSLHLIEAFCLPIIMPTYFKKPRA
jgi:hypothetical protein